MVTKALLLPSIGYWPVKRGSLAAERLKRGAVIEETRRTVRFPPRFGDAVVADDVVDGQGGLIE